MKNNIYNYAISYAKLFLFSLICFTNAASQDCFYNDKIFGKSFAFTPKNGEICIKFSIFAFYFILSISHQTISQVPPTDPRFYEQWYLFMPGSDADRADIRAVLRQLPYEWI